MDKEFLLNNTFNYINTQDDIVDIKIVSIEHHHDNYYTAYYYFIENGKELIDDVHDGAIYVQDGFAYLYRSIEEAKYFELSTAMIKIKLSMKLYTLKNQITGEEKNFIKKTNLAKSIGINTDRVEMAITKNQPINKRTGEWYTIEYRDVNFNIEDC